MADSVNIYRLDSTDRWQGLLAFLFLPCLVILNGFVLATIWRWFIVPLEYPALPLSAACGVCLVASLFGRKQYSDRKYSWEEFGKRMFYIFWSPVLTLCIAWVLKLLFRG